MKATFFFIFFVPFITHGQNQKTHPKKNDWEKVKTTYAPIADPVTHREQLLILLEEVFYKIYDHHASLNTNTDLSQKLAPSGTDIWAEYVNNLAIITEIKQGSNAEKKGMSAGMEISAFNDIPIQEAIKPFLGHCVTAEDTELKSLCFACIACRKSSLITED